jgi:iron(III) transport system ATP-binding protein
MREEIRRVCKAYKLTTVYVTHDQKEALSIADRMAILDMGRIVQVGPPREVYKRPVCRLAAHFIGETDFILGIVIQVVDGVIRVKTEIGDFEGVPGDPTSLPKPSDIVTLSVRPECWKLSQETPARNAVRGRIGGAVYLGEVAQYEFITAAAPLKIYELNPRFVGGDARGPMYASAEPEDVVVLTE